jgi:putative tricarboxylic transport membrane protein
VPLPVSRRGALAGLAVGSVWVASGCRSSADPGDLRLMVPNAPGGGYDTTARVVAQVLEDAGLTGQVEVFNVEGASGVVGLARTARERGDHELMMMMGLGVVGALLTTNAVVDLDQVTPIARLISEPEVVAVASDSDYRSLDQLLTTWRAEPRAVRVGGGSSPGGPDHLCAHLLAEAAGIEPRKVRYQPYDGGGPLLAALFTGEQDVAVSGVGEYLAQVRNDELRILAVTSSDPVPSLDVPTLRELGVDLEIVNWRGLVAPPGLTADERRGLVDLVTRMHDTSQWLAQLRDNGWTDDLLAGSEFAVFLADERDRVAHVLAALGELSA